MKKGTILITLGLLLITAALSLVGYNLLESYKAGKASEAIMKDLEEAIEEAKEQNLESDENGEPSDSGPSGNGNEINATVPSGNGANGNGESEATQENLGELYPDRDMPTYAIAEVGYIGYIFIPSLSLRLPVQSDWNYNMLDISPARYSGSVYQNNMIIGGHSYITHFRSLRGIAPGARVNFYDAEGFSYEYEVEYVMSLNPNQGVILSDEENEDWDLTLFTCNTGGQTRCVVRCARV